MNLKDLLLPAILVYIIGKAAAGYAYKNFELASAKLRLGRLEPGGLNGRVLISVKNSTPAPVSIQAITGEVLYNNSPIASFISTQPFTIAANSTTQIPDIAFFIPFEGLTTTIIQAITSGQWQTFATLKGVARAAGLNIPFSYPLTPF